MTRHDQSTTTSPRKTYHHGNLRRALMDAALDLAQTEGLENVTIRAVAKMTQVSPGAPFRHFASRTALLTTIAEEALDKLIDELAQSSLEVAQADPVTQIRALAMGFLRWAFQNPTHFQILSSRASIDYEGSALNTRNSTIQMQMTRCFDEAQQQSLIKSGDSKEYAITGRALCYGLARMYIDGQFPTWQLDTNEPLRESIRMVDVYLSAISTGQMPPNTTP